ncbi:MAG: 4Fe-4S binding protein [Desulfobacteraceae bacterium]|nr:4Fe-4S binding protein [Desulfobacteraceae bacterium]
MIQQIKSWLEDATVDIFIGYRDVDGHAVPHGYTADRLEELGNWTVGTHRYPLETFALHLARIHPEATIGLLGRDCNQRALNVLSVWNQLHADRIRVLSLSCCPSALKTRADCSYLVPRKSGSFKHQVGVDAEMEAAELEALPSGERWARWAYEFQKCIKCYGCRDICPVCFCAECSLESDELVGTGKLPPEVPIFHLVRATHMAGRCVDCGLCEEACPADIPLRLLYRKVNAIVEDLFGYQTGSDTAQPPLSVLGDRVELEPLPMEKTG